MINSLLSNQLPANARKIKAMITALAVDNGDAISDRTLERK